MTAYHRDAVRRGYDWLDHAPGVTEVSVLHPDFRPGDVRGNAARNAWPRTFYITTEAQFRRIVALYAEERMVCYGLNPRPRTLQHSDGRARSARERDIAISQTLLLDVDLHGTPTDERLDRLGTFLHGLGDYWSALRINAPVLPPTGRGHHLLFAYTPVIVAEHPAFRGQLRTFKDHFVAAHRHNLDRLEARVDSTQDLRRMVRVYGTAKPGIGKVSTFPDVARIPDERLRDYLLRLTPAITSMVAPREITVAACMPDWFPELLALDRALRELWEGRGKPPRTDQSSSGYDYSIATHLIAAGKTDEEIATVLKLRPTGAAERMRKGHEYLNRTVANARARQEARTR